MSNFCFQPTRRKLLAATVLLTTLPVFSASSDGEITWYDLAPKDWDPTAAFKDMPDLSMSADTDPQTQKLYDKMREVWDNAPTVASMEGRTGKIAGYLATLEESKQGVKEFLLVPYFGACIHLPPPPANQIVHVKLSKPVKGFKSMDTVWVHGQFGLERSDSEMGVSGYTLRGDRVTRYKAKTPR